MKLKGQLEQAQLENLTSDPSNLPDGRIWLDTATDKAKFYDGVASRNIVTEDKAAALTNKTVVVASNTITTAASGNLVATELNTALAELQTDIDTRATSSSLSTHTSDTAAHGATGAVVGTSNSQTLTNKTISGADNTLTNIPAATAINGELPIANGGTGQATKATAFDALSPMTTAGDIIIGGASGTGTRLAASTAGYVLTAQGAGVAPIYAAVAATPVIAPITLQKFTSGSGTYNKNYTFVITSGSATVGATYTNNAVTFTVYATVASATQVVMSGNGAPATSGTLTKSTGTGDATLTFSQVLAPQYLRVRMVGGGGGGAGSGTSGGSAATAGGQTTFGSSLLVANGGALGAYGNIAAAGGTASLGTGPIGIAVSGGYAGAPADQVKTPGGNGGVSAFGGAGGGGNGGVSAGLAAAANSGSGGGGGGSAVTAASVSGSGGGAGGYVDAIITSPSATYAYAVGAAGAAGAAGGGVGAAAGGAGAAGIILVEEHYQ